MLELLFLFKFSVCLLPLSKNVIYQTRKNSYYSVYTFIQLCFEPSTKKHTKKLYNFHVLPLSKIKRFFKHNEKFTWFRATFFGLF